MSRLAAALAALLLVPAAARAQDAKKPDADVDARTKAAIERAVERAKEELRDEVRAEIQGAQSAAEFLGAVAEGPKLEFLELDGYLRVRGQLMNNLDLDGGRDASGRFLFPVPLEGGDGRSTLSTANLRLRLEPTLNVSEHVRVRAQVDVLDNHVLGSSTSALFDVPGSPFPVPFYGSSRTVASSDPRLDRPVVSPKRAWAEIETPVGLLSFGRMPSEWGLGVLTHAGGGIDDDFGDTVDRIQFALPPVSTPIGRLAFVPILDFDSEGALYRDPRLDGLDVGLGQPFDADSRDDGRTLGLKVARFDTEDEVRRKLERNEGSLNYGVYYNYRTQRFTYPDWEDAGFDADLASTTAPIPSVRRSAYAHVLDVWVRYLAPRWRIEAEIAGVYGSIGNPQDDPLAASEGKVLLRQWGGALVAEYDLKPNRLTLGGEAGAASGDDAPGFGNVPQLGPTPYGSFEGAQISATDRTLRNFRFNPAYRVDLVLFRHVLGQVTDAMYVKPKVRWRIFPGLALDAQIVYSRAMEAASTPSASADGSGGSANLGIEADVILTYTSGDGFQAFGEWGVLQPLGGLEFQDRSLSRGHFLAFGMAAKF